MNRAQRRQAAKATKSKPGRGRADPFAYLRAIGGVQPFTTAEKTQLCLPVRMAYEALRTGKGDAGDFDTLADVCAKYFALSYEEALKKAARNELPAPTFRIGLGFFVGRLPA